MSKHSESKQAKIRSDIGKELEAKATRKLKAQRKPMPGVWFGLGMMGLIGWSVVVPTLLGTALGIWLDSHYPSGYSWTLMMLVIGLILGCLNAWHWVSKEDKTIRDDEDNNGK